MSKEGLRFCLLVFLLALGVDTCRGTYRPWAYQAQLKVESAGATYGNAPFDLQGRGYVSLISGYSSNASEDAIYVHRTDSGKVNGTSSEFALRALVQPSSNQPTGSFGQYLQTDPSTLLVSSPSSPLSGSAVGAVFVFSGAADVWAESQDPLRPSDTSGDVYFGKRMDLDGDQLIISADGTNDNRGAAYIFERDTISGLWSQLQKLEAIREDSIPGSHFGRRVAILGDIAMIGSRNDEYQGDRSGSGYYFRKMGDDGWTQQQKLFVKDLVNNWQPPREALYEGEDSVFFSHGIALRGTQAIFGTRNVNVSLVNENSVYIWDLTSDGVYSQQQTLFSSNVSYTEIINSVDVSVAQEDGTLYANVNGPSGAAVYVFEYVKKMWSQQQRILPPDEDPSANLTYPTQKGGYLMMSGDESVLIYSRYRNDSCLLISLSDHFVDGWSDAFLTVIAPDFSDDSFQQACGEVNPFLVRYCPRGTEDEGVYQLRIRGPTKRRFTWEVSWQVKIESTGQVYHGDFATKMAFRYEDNAFSYVSGENLKTEDECMECRSVSTEVWSQQQRTSLSFLQVQTLGGSFFISDVEGSLIHAQGLQCNETAAADTLLRCFISIPNGLYVIRMGKGTYNVDTSLLNTEAYFSLCGVSGKAYEQLTFVVEDSECTPIELYNASNICRYPGDLNTFVYG